MITFSEIMKVLPPGSYNLGQLLTHLPPGGMSRVQLARLLSRSKGQFAYGKTLSFRRTREAMLYVVSQPAVPLTPQNEIIAARDEAMREGLTLGIIAGILYDARTLPLDLAQEYAGRVLASLQAAGWKGGAQ